MSNSRRFCVAIGTIGFFSLLALFGSVVSPQAAGQNPTGSNHTSAITLPTDRKAQGVMNKAEELKDEKEWAKAAETFQYLLTMPEDGFVQVTENQPNAKARWVSIRSHANQLIGSMSPEGLKAYEGLYGREAAARLAEARERNDLQMLASVAQRYLHTQAGVKAAELLATRFLERDEPMMAALYFERLMDGPNGPELSAHVLLKACLSFYRAGDKNGGDLAWKLLTTKAKRDGGVALNGEIVPLERLRDELDKVAKDETKLVYHVPYYRGSPNRTGQGVGGPINLEPAWTQSTLLPRGDGRPWVEDMIASGIRQLDQKSQLSLPGFHPVAINGQVIYRTYDGVYVAHLKEKTLKYNNDETKFKPGDLAWWSHTDGGILFLLSDPNRKGTIDGWRANYNQWGGPNYAIFENSVTGTLSTDGTHVFAIDDLVLQPHPFTVNQARMGWGMQLNFGALKEMVERNTLKIYHLGHGSLRWDLGGKQDTSDLKESVFLGPPLPMGGKLYLLNEKDGAVRLVCLEAKDSTEKQPPPPEILWTQILASSKDKVHLDFNRRMHAAHLAYGDGILVCPTNAGIVLGVDLLTHSLVWGHPYREPDPPVDPKKQPIRNFNPQPNNMTYLLNEWKATAPAIAEGKVVFAAPDSQAIHCLNLKDGTEKWKVTRLADDLYFAGIFKGKAIVVSKNSVRALNLLDGKEVWKRDNTGTPSGQGVAADNVYYLPVKSTADTREPGVVAIKLDNGEIATTHKAIRKDGKLETPGNLIFHDGFLLSQTVNSLVCYPLVKKEDGDQPRTP